MDYETQIYIKQYLPDVVYYSLKVIDVSAMRNHYYDGCASTIDDTIKCIHQHIKEFQNDRHTKT